MYGASSSALRRSRSASFSWNSGITSRANSSRLSQMCSCRFRPACWMKTIWSTPVSVIDWRYERTAAGVPIARPSGPGNRFENFSKLPQMSVRPGRCSPYT